MPWRCPACRTEIQHNPADARPRTNEAYRCHVCRLELVFDEQSSKMMIAPFEADHHVALPPRPRTIPAPAIETNKPRRK
jgi:rubredoxin